MFIASYVTPTPATILAGVDLPLHTGDRVIANCAQAYAYTLPEMTIDEQAEFNANVTCVYPPQESFDASYRHYALALRQRGFEDDTGDYVQSGMRIACNQTHTVVMGIQSNFVPSFVVDPETDEVIDTPGSGGLANMAASPSHFSSNQHPAKSVGAGSRSLYVRKIVWWRTVRSTLAKKSPSTWQEAILAIGTTTGAVSIRPKASSSPRARTTPNNSKRRA